jgi:N-hydroxyarylamine O-acetyltransferase
VVKLDEYLHRIGYTGPRTCTIETLASVHARHPAAIPFENLDPLLGRPVRLDIESLQQKLVAEGRGGYCYEHNLLLAEALRGLGFEVRGLAARVLRGAPPGTVRPRTHMLLGIRVDGATWIADVGFGGLTLTAPLRLEPGLEQPTTHETFRVTRASNGFVLEAHVGGTWQTLYEFTEEEQALVDYEIANWYTSTHPSSIFLTSLMAARARPDARCALLNNALTIYHRNGAIERQVLAGGDVLAATLRDVFGIRLPENPGLLTALERVASAQPEASRL